MSRGALEGIKVVELGQRVAAPYCAKLFADYGADVVKVEPPAGDATRRWGPFPNDVPHPEKSGLYHFLNTNKRSVTLDVGSFDERDLLRQLMAGADVLIEDNPPERMQEWGLDFDTLSALNPNLVMISITPFGQTGPYAGWKGYDLNAFHLTGAGSRYCGTPGNAPLEHGTFAAEFFGAAAASAWGLAAFYGREQAGGGQQLDVSCAEAITATFVGGQNIGAYAQDGVFGHRTGVGMPLGAPATIVPCKDGHVWMLALEPGQWNGLARVMGNPDWMQLEMFQDMATRAQNADAIYPLIEEWTGERGKQEIMDQCQEAGCPITAVFDVAEAVQHPHLTERGYLVDLEHAELGRIRSLGAPFKLPDCPGGPERAAPLLGQHNSEVLANLASGTVAKPAACARPATAGAGGALPLDGIRVANFGWVWAGPVTGQTLGFLGAEVYKIESRSRVDLLRTLPPFAGGIRDPDRSLSNHACWAGNGSVTLDLKREEARDLARQLVAKSDVVIENFGPCVIDRLGLGYDDLRKVKPDLVMFSMPAAGLFGPLKDIRTYGLSLTSTTGLDSLTGYFGGPPVPVENAFSDPYNGILGAFAVLTALRHRDRTGRGQHVDYSQQEAVMQMVGPAFMDYEMNGRVATTLGNRHPLGAASPHGVFPCAGEDRWISIAVHEDDEWRNLVRAMDHPEWATSPELAGGAGRLERLEAIHENLAAWTRAFDDRELAERLQREGVPAAPVLNVADLLEDPHYRARGTFLSVRHPLGFDETIYGGYVKMSRTPARVEPGPVMGRDNDFVFKQLLGLPEERYREFVEEQIIY
ncbi:MAG: CoA transferase [Deltaproteobacteria bacterium]|nr:CoA transferase [Deltaproteobacteria bacterium]MBW2392672.1 CoA transferase [Deltaproteobacteria bacterium]